MPSALSDNVMKKNIVKVTKVPPLLDQKLLDMAVSDVVVKLQKGMNNSPTDVLSLEEAIKGCDAYLGPIDRSTSPGIPWINKMEGKKGKQKWMGKDDDWIIDHPELKEATDAIIDGARKRQRYTNMGVFNASLKSERRPIQKVIDGKTRVFAAGPMDLNICHKMYFGSFVRHIKKNKIYNEIAYGANVFSDDWKQIYKLLKSVGDNGIAGDFSGYDGDLNPQILSSIVDIVNELMDDGEENMTIRETLFEYLKSSIWRALGYNIMLDHSQPSGNYLTTIINCIYNMIIFRYAFLLCQIKQGLKPNLATFAEHVRCVFYGDDSILSVSDKILSWFNQITITDAMKIAGHTYTDESKNSATRLSKPLTECSFLKREFRIEDSLVFCPLDKNTITEMTLWTTTNNTRETGTKLNMYCAAMEACAHGKAFFDSFTAKIKRYCKENRVEISLPIYSYALGWWLTSLSSHSVVSPDIFKMKDILYPQNP
jgi:hypothetical protein